MSRTHRLFDLLQVLRRHRTPVSGAALAEETGISLRTLYRDIAALQALGAEIEGAPGFGYVLRPGFLLPPLMFSETELEALALGLKWVAERTDPELARAASDARSKLSSVLPGSLSDRFEDEGLLIGKSYMSLNQDHMPLLRQAIREERKIFVRYGDVNSDMTERTLWPVAMGFFDAKRILVAHCELRGTFRHFRVDRILAAEILADKLPKRRRSLLKDWRRTLLTETDRVRIYTPPTDAPTDGPIEGACHEKCAKGG